MKASFINFDDAFRRLAGSIVFYKGVPHLVDSDQGNNRANLYLFSLEMLATGDCKPVRVPYNSDDLDIACPTMGYVNHNDNAYYLSRIPDRRNVQGLNRSVIVVHPSEPNGLYKSMGLYNCLINSYPSIDEALDSLSSKNKKMSIAFHRHFAVEKSDGLQILLYYRTRLAGYFSLKPKTITVLPGEQASFIGKILREARFGYEILA